MNTITGIRTKLPSATLIVAAAVFVTGIVPAQQNSDLPRLANGNPDFNGVWYGGFQLGANALASGGSVCFVDCEEIDSGGAPGGVSSRPMPDRPNYRTEFQAEVDRLNEYQVHEDPVLKCANPGVPRLGAPDKIVHTEREIVFLYDDVNGGFHRIVPLDGRPHRADVEDTSMGDSIGWWDVDTLLVETVNFNDATWLTDDGSFHTSNLRVVERLTRSGDELTWQATAHDSAVLEEPWSKRPVVTRLSDVELFESPPCVERDLSLMQDLSNHDNAR